MDATVRHCEGGTDPGEMARGAREESLLDVLRQVPGFVNYGVMDAGGGTFISLTVYEDRSGAEESNRRVAEWVQQSGFGSLVPNPPQITVGEVVMQESS